MVTSCYDNIGLDDAGNVAQGAFSAAISGPGSMTLTAEPTGAIPEPTATLLTSIGALVLFRRRRA